MRFTISGKNLEVTDSMRKAVMEKLGKLERYFTADTPIIVTMSVTMKMTDAVTTATKTT